MNESWGFLYSEFFYCGIISYMDMTEPLVTADLRGGEQGFIFPICPWVIRATKMLILPWLDTLLPANNFRKDLTISGFLPGLQLQLSEDCPAYPLHWGGFKVQPLGPLSMQQLCEDKDDQLPAFIACELLVSNF